MNLQDVADLDEADDTQLEAGAGFRVHGVCYVLALGPKGPSTRMMGLWVPNSII